MKIPKFKYYSVLIALLFYSSAFSQFNTLMRTSTQKEKLLPKTEEIEKTGNGKDEKQIKPQIRNKLFNLSAKSELQKETKGSTKWLTSQIDSLKNQMLSLSLTKNEDKKFDFKKIEDSIIKIFKENNRNRSDSGKPIRQFNYLDDSEIDDGFTSKINMPLKSRMTITSPFGSRIHPIFGTRKLHNGTDFKANYENVYSVLDGIIIESSWDSGGGGNYIKIRHSDSFVTSYLHLSEIYYKTGESIKAGFIIAKSGNSGNSTGAHLHFSVTEKGKYINPVRFLNDLIKANNLIATYYAK